jgi:hypothetical protein
LADVDAGGGGGVGTIPTTTEDCSSAAERDAVVEAVLLARLDTAVGVELEDVPRPAEAGLAGTPTVLVPAGFEESPAVELPDAAVVGLFGVGAVPEVVDGVGCAADCVPVVDVGPVVWVLGAAGDGVAGVLGLGDGGGVLDEFDGDAEVLALGSVGGGADWLGDP